MRVKTKICQVQSTHVPWGRVVGEGFKSGFKPKTTSLEAGMWQAGKESPLPSWEPALCGGTIQDFMALSYKWAVIWTPSWTHPPVLLPPAGLPGSRDIPHLRSRGAIINARRHDHIRNTSSCLDVCVFGILLDSI